MPNHGTSDYYDQCNDGHWYRSSIRAFRCWSYRHSCPCHAIEQNLEDPNRLSDVFDSMRSKIGETDVESSLDLIVNAPGNADATRISQVFDPGGNVHAISINAIILVKNISQVNANAKIHTPIVRQFGPFSVSSLLWISMAQWTAFSELPNSARDIIAGCINDASIDAVQ
jgi:hypothetical protein